MPVSKKRKKKKSRSSGRASGSYRSQAPAVPAPVQGDREVAQAFQSFTAYRDRVNTQRVARAEAIATELVADLAREVAERPGMIVTDALCERLGTLLDEDQQSGPDERIGPHHLAEAMPAAAEAAVTAALTATTGQAEAWTAPWRVLTALTSVLPYPLPEVVSETIIRLYELPTGRALPAAPAGPEMVGPALWTSDRYGSRFAVTAAISAADEPMRWYLWDIDACGHEAFTVHSGYYPSSEAALAAWQTGVGQTASAGTVLTPADDRWLLAPLLPAEMGVIRPGGEGVDQLAEYHRSKRLAEVVGQATPRPDARPETDRTTATAAVEFAAWLRARIPEQHEPPEDLSELVAELVDSWNLNGIDAVFATCSPHRVALCVLHMRNYYLDEDAEQLVALLPEWTRWLAERNATAPELADRCLPYAHGHPHPQVGADDYKIDYLARVIE
ncbi:MAG: hypothetical protein L0H64_01425 [Pseudonocardia sp.]|nr:hypothetical protein [Pseudonocardia sp.]